MDRPPAARIWQLTLLALALVTPARAQIHADFTVSQGGAPIGTFRVLLKHTEAPRPCANFIGLATGQRSWVDLQTGAVRGGEPFYDGLIFHRLIHDFIIQGGDPNGNGSGGPGYVFQDQFHPSLRHTGAYILSMAHAGPNSNGSQFFITLGTSSFLDDYHSVFGEVINDTTYPDSRAIIDDFMDDTLFPTTNERPDTEIRIDSVVISGPSLAGFDIDDPALGLPTVLPQQTRISHDPLSGDFDLIWDRQRKFDYPIYYGVDAATWAWAGSLLSMDNEPDYTIGLGPIASTPKAFYRNAAVDYSLAVEAPQAATLTANGATYQFATGGGTLTITFDGSGGGTWAFSDGSSGALLVPVSVTNTASFPIIPDSGDFLTPNPALRTYGRFLSIREILVFFDGPVGPAQLTAIRPVLSFHEPTAGWYDGPVNSNLAFPPAFRGTFNFTAAP